jgi:hypothetical protein
VPPTPVEYCIAHTSSSPAGLQARLCVNLCSDVSKNCLGGWASSSPAGFRARLLVFVLMRRVFFWVAGLRARRLCFEFACCCVRMYSVFFGGWASSSPAGWASTSRVCMCFVRMCKAFVWVAGLRARRLGFEFAFRVWVCVRMYRAFVWVAGLRARRLGIELACVCGCLPPPRGLARESKPEFTPPNCPKCCA